MINKEILSKAGEESVIFIDSMTPAELGMFTLRKAFEMGYIHGANYASKDEPIELDRDDDDVGEDLYKLNKGQYEDI
mgnify:CR=1 FL=1